MDLALQEKGSWLHLKNELRDTKSFSKVSSQVLLNVMSQQNYRHNLSVGTILSTILFLKVLVTNDIKSGESTNNYLDDTFTKNVP